MLKIKQKQDEIIERLLALSYSIARIYDKLAEFEIKEDTLSTEVYLEYLLIALEEEDKIYQKLLEIATPKNINQIQNRIEFLNQRYDETSIPKDFILDRIEDYVAKMLYLNPFLSMQKNFEVMRYENETAIINQYNADYIYLVIYLAIKKIEETKDRDLKSDLIIAKYQTIYCNKEIEQKSLLSKKLEVPTITGRARCILFGQDKDLIHETYLTRTTGILDYILNIILNISNLELTNSKEAIYLEQTQLCNLKASLYLLEKDELFTIGKKIYSLLKNPQLDYCSLVLQDITNIFKEIVECPEPFYKPKTLIKAYNKENLVNVLEN